MASAHEERRKRKSFSDEEVNSVLVNPFLGKDHTAMDHLVQKFMAETEIDPVYLEDIRKGAFLAQNNRAFAHLREDKLELKPDETGALEEETHHKWRQPWILYALVGCCSLGAAVQGWDETAVNGAQIFYQDAFGLRDDKGLLGLVNSAPYLCCAVLGCWLTYPLNHYLGRRGTIFVTCLISSITCLWQAFTNTWWHLFIARFCLGLGIGAKSATVPIYAAECTPASIRGAFVMMWQMWTAFGIMLGYMSGVAFKSVLQAENQLVCPYYSQTYKPSVEDRGVLLGVSCSLGWRLMLASPMVLPLVVVAYIFTLPESPRWLLLKARSGDRSKYKKAFESLKTLRQTRLQAARDLFLINHLLDGEEKIKKQRHRFAELWLIPRNRRALTASLIVMFFQQFCGVNVLAYYSSSVFEDAKFSKQNALLLSMGFGIVNFVFAIPAIFTIDKYGRRPLLLITFPFMALFQLLTGLAFLFKGNTQTVLVTVGMYLFCVAYSPGEGPVPFVYSAESMPLYVRDYGMSISTATLWLFNFVVAMSFPKLSDKRALGETGAFGYYAAWCVVGWVLILLFVPETKGLTLEQLDARFSIPTRQHASFAIKQVIYKIRYFTPGIHRGRKPKLGRRLYGKRAVQMDDHPPRKISFDEEIMPVFSD